VRVLFDSSAFAKRFVHEAGSDAVAALCEQADEVVLSAIAVPEIISAFCRLRRETRITEANYTRLKAELLGDVVDAIICDVAPDVIAKSVEALERNTLRGMDAIHVGTAIVMHCDLFVSSDARQCEAAASAGLSVERV
jgi:uncharacterized protein